MSAVDLELQEHWTDEGNHYRHNSGQWEAHWWNTNYDTVSLFKTEHGEMFWEMDGRLNEVVRYVMEKGK